MLKLPYLSIMDLIKEQDILNMEEDDEEKDEDLMDGDEMDIDEDEKDEEED